MNQRINSVTSLKAAGEGLENGMQISSTFSLSTEGAGARSPASFNPGRAGTANQPVQNGETGTHQRPGTAHTHTHTGARQRPGDTFTVREAWYYTHTDKCLHTHEHFRGLALYTPAYTYTCLHTHSLLYSHTFYPY